MSKKVESLSEIGNGFEFIIKNYPSNLSTGTLINIRRKTLHLSLREISKVTGISTATLCRIENDVTQIDADAASRIGMAIGIHPVVILYPNGFGITKELKSIEKKAKSQLSKSLKMLEDGPINRRKTAK